MALSSDHLPFSDAFTEPHEQSDYIILRFSVAPFMFSFFMVLDSEDFFYARVSASGMSKK